MKNVANITLNKPPLIVKLPRLKRTLGIHKRLPDIRHSGHLGIIPWNPATTAIHRGGIPPFLPNLLPMVEQADGARRDCFPGHDTGRVHLVELMVDVAFEILLGRTEAREDCMGTK